jgi:geranylgeranyl reductase family protein
MSKRIVIIGAGPAGATAALCLARQGRHEVVLLDRDAFPRVKTCGSALSPRCLGLIHDLGLDETFRPLAYRIRGVHFTGPAGRTATLTGKEGAWIIPRSRFDAELVWAAERGGARFVPGFRATRLLRDASGRVTGVSDGTQEIEADLTVVADGAHSRFSADDRPRRRIATIMAWYEGIPFTEGHMEMWFDRRVAPWYGWLFPENETEVNIGICYDPDDAANPREIFQEILERHVGDERMKGASMTRKFRGAPIVYTSTVGSVAASGALWIGESARLTNAATGEGIGYAMQSAMIAAAAIERFPDPVLAAQYERALRRAFTPRLKIAVGTMRFIGSPAFAALSSMLAYRPVEKAITYALEHV